MTLTRLLLAWLPVTLEFVIVGAGEPDREPSPDTSGRRAVFTPRDVLWRALEAAAVTLFGSLWFDSLGHGGWWLLFGLAGLMVALARFPGSTAGALDRRTAVTRTLRDVVRYVLAGAILAWVLG
ncbi:MAG: hypothetical protein DMD28_05860 [Gemmatimonadetes bacterium]|nr:MAG: hypothetical protein DMD28_05860 [Gemmatimonadota bacterium]